MGVKLNAPKGTKDILPDEIYLWEKIENKAKEICYKFGYKQIRTPEFEHSNVFIRSIGDATDIVQKEMYTFTHRDKDTFCLKPEGTSGVVRAYVEHGMASLPSPVKLFYLTNCFRCENPQKGRQRQFHQFGIEAIGSPNPAIDAEVIMLADLFLKELGIKNVSLKINSVGCPECRKKYYEKLKAFLMPYKDKLCDDCKNRLEKNPMRVLDCKNDRCKEIVKDAPVMIDNLCDNCKSHMLLLEKYLESAGVKYETDPNIVRGLDYYTQTAFEFVCNDLGAQSTVCGGGRYNSLVEMLGGSDTPGIGFALGIERLLLIMQAQGLIKEEKEYIDLYIVPLGEEESIKAFSLMSELINEGLSVSIDTMNRSLKAQMKYADKINARYVAIYGESEMEKGIMILRDMKTKQQQEVSPKEIKNILKEKLNK